MSTADQSLDRQWDLLVQYNIDKIYEEKESGATRTRPELGHYLREGDIVYVESISRLARNTLDFLSIVVDIANRKADLISLKENIDTSTPTGKFILTVFAALTELERETLKVRQREGIAAAKKRGKHLGRPPAETDKNFFKYYEMWRRGEMTAVAAMKEAGYKPTTWYKLVKKH